VIGQRRTADQIDAPAEVVIVASSLKVPGVIEEAADVNNSAVVRFDPHALGSQLPAGTLRYLAHAIRPGAPIPRVANVVFTGQLRLRPQGPWLRFRARETLMAASGFVFAARAWLGPLPVTTHDRYLDGHADSRIRLFGVLPIVTRRGPDADRAMRSRLVVESVWLPSAFLPDVGAAWTEEDGHLHLTLPVHAEDVAASVSVGPSGELQAMRLDRWSDLTDTHAYASIPFETRVEAERRFGDYTIPSQLRSLWWTGTDREFEFFRATVQEATFSV
jgi:hypothetical protein